MAQHITRAYGQPWSGNPDALVRRAAEVQEIVRSASHSEPRTSIVVEFPGRRQSTYQTPQEFLAGIRASDIPQITSVMLVCTDYQQTPAVLVITVHLIRGPWQKPFVTATGDDPSIVDGAARRVAAIFDGRGWWQGLRRDEPSRYQRFRARAGFWWVVAVTATLTAVITAVVTVYLTRLLTGH